MRDSLIPALNHLGNTLLGFIKEEPDRWMDLKTLIEEGQFYQNSGQDLGLFLESLSKLIQSESNSSDTEDTTQPTTAHLPTAATQELQTATTEAYRALNYAIINDVLGTLYPQFDPATQMGPRGLTIWLPKTPQEYHQRIHEFSESCLYSVTPPTPPPGWGSWMEKMYPLTP